MLALRPCQPLEDVGRDILLGRIAQQLHQHVLHRPLDGSVLGAATGPRLVAALEVVADPPLDVPAERRGVSWREVELLGQAQPQFLAELGVVNQSVGDSAQCQRSTPLSGVAVDGAGPTYNRIYERVSQ